MDPVTHGIAGALIGKSFFSKRNARVAIFAATLGAVFPDVDIFVDAASHDPLAIARYHRGFAHSFVGLPIFAAALAWLTRAGVIWYAKRTRREIRCPSFAMLFVIYAAGIASHIILDGFTSFGTRLLNPFSTDRVAWDWLFIIDFVFTALLLVPQLIAWVHDDPSVSRKRGGAMFVFFAILALGAWALAGAAGFPFSLGVVAIAVAIFMALCFLPARGHWGSRIGRARWCQAGFAVACAYVIACGVAHHVAMDRVRAFADSHHVDIERIGALPLPPSMLDWNGMILTPTGVYQSSFSLLNSHDANFHFVADSPSNQFIAEAARLEPVQTYLWFARFPVVRYFAVGDRNIVEYADPRFFEGSERGPTPFTFGVIFDAQGKLLHYGWIQRGPNFPRGGSKADKTQ
ncbi:MAG TPA: metal-dependent hydrolase [Candidatus Acidoferrales bacterium]|nr:metal-dependent hydrolase [Candidatus Acidoferrales bacterium]